jgi:hypothetical protein
MAGRAGRVVGIPLQSFHDVVVDLGVQGLLPLLHEGVVRRLVALPAARGQGSTQGSEGLVGLHVGVEHVGQARTMAALALHVVIALGQRPRVSHFSLGGVAERPRGVTVLACLVGVPARLEPVPRIGVRARLPPRLLADMAVPAHGQLRVRFIVTQESSGFGSGILEERPLDINRLFIRTAERADPEHCGHGQDWNQESRLAFPH